MALPRHGVCLLPPTGPLTLLTGEFQAAVQLLDDVTVYVVHQAEAVSPEQLRAVLIKPLARYDS